MPRNAFDIGQMLSVPGIRLQLLEAVEELAQALGQDSKHPLGRAYRICDEWQRRFESALRSPVPDWMGIAAFRCTDDFNLTPEVLDDLKRTASQSGGEAPPTDAPKNLATLEECWRAYVQYLKKKKDLYSGKFVLLDRAVQSWFMQRLNKCAPMLGGQAGNIVYLWHCIGSDPIIYTPYFSKRMADLLVHQPGLGNVRVLRIENGKGEINRLKDNRAKAGVLGDNKIRVAAPSAGSMTAVENGRRIIYSLPGFHVFESASPSMADWVQVQFYYHDQALLDQPMPRTANNLNWPSIPLFCECRINTRLKQLEITLADEEQISAMFKRKVDFAVLGGMDAIFHDEWLVNASELQLRLLNILEQQIRTMANCGIRIGVELSNIPAQAYLFFLRRMCEQGIISALGINGVDELPRLTGESSLNNKLSDLWLDPQEVPEPVRTEAAQSEKHCEYLTFLRAKKLAEATRVRTLFVHTLTLDLILMRAPGTGGLAYAQLGDIKGKGFIISTLLQRAYGDTWLNELKRMPPTINPEAMAKLNQFAKDFQDYTDPESAERLVISGCWLAPSPDQYSLAVVPVVWPPVSDDSGNDDLPEKLNPTGAGDMTFGAFFLLGGV